MPKTLSHIRISWTSFSAILLYVVSFIFSFWLMTHTLSYDTDRNFIFMRSKLWSDFGAHIPLVRSFSMGDNWPPESPLFPGERIRYHYLFYFLAGMLEKTGIRIDWAINIPSIIGMMLLLVMIVLFARTLFRSLATAWLSVLFFLFNGTLSFVAFFRKNPLSTESLSDILKTIHFPTFGPWDGQNVTAFWNWNIYTNQRHLALSYGLAMVSMYLILSISKNNRLIKNVIKTAVACLILGVLMTLNQAAFLIGALFVAWLFVVQPSARIPLVVGGMCVFPGAILYLTTMHPPDLPVYNPWYLINGPITFQNVGQFWFDNLGLHIVLIPLGCVIAPRKAKIAMILPLILLFILPNIFRFSPDMINNHKFFNFFILIGNMFSAYVLVFIWRIVSRFGWIPKILVAPLLGAMLFFLTLSGVIDAFAVANDTPGGLNDIGSNDMAQYISNNTPANTIILNSFWFYHPASLAGRKVFNGYSYFTWSYGYDKDSRERIVNSIYGARTVNDACWLLTAYDIQYVELSTKPEGYIKTNTALWHIVQPAYTSKTGDSSLYAVNTICNLPKNIQYFE